MAVSDSIIQMLKDNLHITYMTDESTDRRLQNEASAGIGYIRKYCDPAASCEPGTRYASLLCEYVLRAESGALDTFRADYAVEITSAKCETDAERYAAAMGYSDELEPEEDDEEAENA